MASKNFILGEISAERDLQDREWGGPSHDDEHSINDWTSFRGKFHRRAADPIRPGYRRESLIKLAALCVAEIESIDRIEGRDS